MIAQAPILALLIVGGLASLVALWAAGFGLRVLARWDLASGSRAQVQMERRTELVSTLLAAVLAAQVAALILLVFNADRMAPLFVGAMCAIGTFNANAWGFPALYAKIAVFFAAALWLMLDRADRLGSDYPLTRAKYAAALVLAPLVLASAGLELAYFLNLETDVITSCCSRMFTPANSGLSADLSALPPGRALGLLAAAGAAVALTGAAALWRGRGYLWLAAAGAVLFLIGLAAVVSVISPYVYEHPNHHCPFCLLKREYGYVGYALYVPLFAATALALGAGMLEPAARIPSLAAALPARLRHAATLALAGYAVFGAVCVAIIARSNLILFG